MFKFEYLNDLQERFFTWCDNAVQDHIERKDTMLSGWRPRKNPDGSYELVLLMATTQDKAASKFTVPVPEEFHKLLEREYFINHPPDEEEES
ncbi:MAG: hypothetical protein PHD36_06605 [Desulfotomaculaceae bacterium]|nr:hypothetical protein [Desulfotomaculaceae bacterium]